MYVLAHAQNISRRILKSEEEKEFLLFYTFLHFFIVKCYILRINKC